MKNPAVHIMTNRKNGTLYTGVTSHLIKRVFEHKEGLTHGFAKKYGCKLLVFYEVCDSMVDAIEREKTIKGGSRKQKLALIEGVNPTWKDLYYEII